MSLFNWAINPAGELGFGSWFTDPVGQLIENKGDNKYLKTLHGLTDPVASGPFNIEKGYDKGGWRGAFGALSDTAAYGIGDTISPQYTKPSGDNPIYDTVGPIMAGYWGGPFAGFAADEWAKGSEYDTVGKYHIGTLVGGGSDFFNMNGGSSWFTDMFKGILGGTPDNAPVGASAGDAGTGGASNLKPVAEQSWWQKILGNMQSNPFSMNSSFSGGQQNQQQQSQVVSGSDATFKMLSDNLAKMKLDSIRSDSELEKLNLINPFR